MNNNSLADAAKTVVRRNTEEVQGGGNFDVFDELFADARTKRNKQKINPAL